ARRLKRCAAVASPYCARRIRFAPNVAVSMISAPASRYSRWIVPMRSGRVVGSSSRQARCGMPRLYRSVPIAPSTSTGPRARRARNRARGAKRGGLEGDRGDLQPLDADGADLQVDVRDELGGDDEGDGVDDDPDGQVHHVTVLQARRSVRQRAPGDDAQMIADGVEPGTIDVSGAVTG